MNLSLHLRPFPYQPGIFNPFTNTIELIRFTLNERFNIGARGYRLAVFIVLPGATSYDCDPALEMMNLKSGLGS